jgi:ParB/Sulfiredoxin domain
MSNSEKRRREHNRPAEASVLGLPGLPDDVFAMLSHPAAEMFPLMPDDELRDLAADIKKNGLQYSIIIDGGKILDGRNRLKACKLAGVQPRFVPLDGIDPITFVLSVNLLRRHLTPLQRREVIAKVLKQEPARSNRRVAAETKSDHKTVGKVRKGLEATGEIPQLKKTQGRDGKARPVARADRAKAKPATFDEDKAGDRLRDWLRAELAKWPKQSLPKAIHWIKQIITKEFKA